jgi:N-acetylglucosamine-6-phosphate deacetylase
MPTQFFAERVFTGTEVLFNQIIIVENGRITGVEGGTARTGMPQVTNLAPGLFDSHINGGEKYYFTERANEETIDDIYQASVNTGAAYVLPTLITSPHENILKGIEATRSYMAKNPESGVLGMHLEGPFLNPVKRGAHLAAFVRKPTDSELEEIIRYGKDVIRLITIAPEMFTEDQLQMLLESDMTVSAGHSNATYAEAMTAFDLGIQLVTHLYNAPVIIDGVHCDFGAASVAYKIKKDKLFLISDALFLGQKVTQFKWGEFDAYLKDGKYINSDGNLAGATISLGDAVRNAVEIIGIPVQEAIEMATIRPATALGLQDKIGSIASGYPAVFTTFDDNLENFEVLRY